MDEWDELKLKHKETKSTLILQIGAPWCQHCHPVEEEFLKFTDKFNFTFVYTDASDTELVDHFSCSKLPAIVVHIPEGDQTHTIESVRTQMVEGILTSSAPPKLILDDDF